MKTIEILKELEKLIANALRFNEQSEIFGLDADIINLVNEQFGRKVSAKAKELDPKDPKTK